MKSPNQTLPKRNSAFRVLVLGGTGNLGRDLVERLVVDGIPVRVLSRTRSSDTRIEWVYGDLATGKGLESAFGGITHVINAATNSPIAQRGSIRITDLWKSPADVDLDGTQRVLDIAAKAGIEHYLHVSIVGLEDSKLPYSRIKLAGETLVRASSVNWSVVRATPYFYLVARMLNNLHRLPIWLLPSTDFQPVDTRDVADYVIACLFGASRGSLPAIGGPEISSYASMARIHLSARRMQRCVIDFPLSQQWARQAGIVVTDGNRGLRSWSNWIQDQVAGLP